MFDRASSYWAARCLGVALLAALPGISAAASDDDPFAGNRTLELPALVAAVLERNPSIESARQAWRAAETGPRQQRAFDDPMIGYSLAPQSIDAADMRYGQVVEIGQRLPFFGKRGLRAAIAEAEARAAGGDYEGVRRGVALMAATLFAEYYAAFRAVEINDRHGQLLDEMLASAKASYVTGRIPQHTLVRVELQSAHVAHDGVEVSTATAIARAGINALLHRAPGAPLPPPPAAIRATDLTTRAIDSVDDAIAARPEVATARARIEAAASAVDLARREYFPDLTLGAEYNSMWDDEKHRTMVGVRIELPIQIGRRKAALEAAEAEAGSRRADLTSVIDTVAMEIETAKRRYHEALHVVEIYRERLLPAAHDVTTSARAAFTAATGEFGDVIDAEHELRDIELQYENAIASLATRRAQLEWSIGRIPGVEP